jgi:hypothetical protein
LHVEFCRPLGFVEFFGSFLLRWLVVWVCPEAADTDGAEHLHRGRTPGSRTSACDGRLVPCCLHR